jgi:leader peptidase (prepilin peptidase) / N-methyltransferase
MSYIAVAGFPTAAISLSTRFRKEIGMIPSPWGPLPWWLVYPPVVILGLALGSFANVLIYRLPKEASIVKPGSHCPKCDRPIRPIDNIPVLSYILLRGKCRGCGTRISIQYPLVEAASGAIAAIVLAYCGLSYATFAYALLFIAILALVIIDIIHWLLPFALTLPLAIVGLIGSLAFGMRPLADCLLGMLIGFVIFFALMVGGKVLFKKDAMGGGDIAFGIMAGAFLGWKLLILMIFIASFIGMVISIPLLMTNKFKVPDDMKSENVSKTQFPFGPFLAVALVICVLFGDKILRWYLGVLGV